AQLERESLDESASDGFRPPTVVRRDQQPDEVAKRRFVTRRQLERTFRRGGRFAKPTGPPKLIAQRRRGSRGESAKAISLGHRPEIEIHRIAHEEPLE